jgi:hypothetical protein
MMELIGIPGLGANASRIALRTSDLPGGKSQVEWPIPTVLDAAPALNVNVARNAFIK